MEGWLPALMALAGVIVGTWLGGFLRRAENRSLDEAQWRRRTAEALASAQTLLTDADPQRVSFNFNPETTPQLLDDLRSREKVVRLALAELGFGHPSENVRSLTKRLEVVISRNLTDTGWVVFDMMRHRDYNDQLKRAQDEQAAALGILELLREALHRPQPRWRRRPDPTQTHTSQQEEQPGTED